MPWERTILHCDCNAFFASVECLLDPELKKVPMAVAGDPKARHGIVVAKNELAKAYGIQTTDTVWQAKKKCHSLVLVKPHGEEYVRCSKAVNKIYEQYTDLTEQFGIDETFLDITHSIHLFGNDAGAIANEIRQRIYDEIGITISIGVSFNRTLAKLGSDYKKPNAVTMLAPGEYRKIIDPLPISALLYAGPVITEKLHACGIETIEQLANAHPDSIEALFGKIGRFLYEISTGQDDSPVLPYWQQAEQKSISKGRTFPSDLLGWEDLHAAVCYLCIELCFRLKEQGKLTHVIQVQIKDTKLHTIGRQRKLSHPTDLYRDILHCSMELIGEFWDMAQPVRHMAIACTELTSDRSYAKQTTLFDGLPQQDGRQQQLEGVIHQLRCRYGEAALLPAVLVNNQILRRTQ